MENYVRITKTVNDRGFIIPYDEASIKKIINESNGIDYYRSLYLYDKAIVDHFEKTGTVADYKGKTYIDKLIFDLDSANLEVAKQDTIELLYRLQQAGVNVEESCKIWFSGNKGMHVELRVEGKEFTPEELKNICSNIASGLSSFDSTIYNANRIFRLENTKHNKSGLYKVELDPNDLVELKIEQIKEMAKQPSARNFEAVPVKDASFLDKFKSPVAPKVIKQAIVDTDEGEIRGLGEIDFSLCPKEKPRCIFLLESGCMVPGVGKRNAVFLALCRYYMNQGLHKEACYGLLKGIARNNARLYPEAEPFSKDEIWKNIVSGTYSSASFKQRPGAFGSDPLNETLKFYCDLASKYTNKPCPLHNHVQLETNPIIQIADVHDTFEKYAVNIDKNLVYTGYDFIDKNAAITTGTTTLLVGCSGSAKTTCSLNILENANLRKQPSMFFSADMSKNLVYQKLAHMSTDFSRDELFRIFVEKDRKKQDYIKECITRKFGTTFFDFSKTLSLDQIRDRIFNVEQKMGEKLKFVLIDYVGRLSGPHSDKYANASYNALKSVEMAEVTDAAWIMIAQISRSTGSELSPLRTKRCAKETGDWEESVTTQINIWRPYYSGGELDDIIRAFLAKSRMGPEVEDILHFNGERSLVRDMTYEEKTNYNVARGEKAEREFYKQKMNKGTFST